MKQTDQLLAFAASLRDDGDLKKCPFCGGEAEENWTKVIPLKSGHESQMGWIECKECEARVEFTLSTREHSDEDWNNGSALLKKKWNTRTPDTNKAADVIEELVKQRDILVKKIVRLNNG